ncbi:MAG: hypothetical protein AABW90_03615 [Nanoarchaeota archaeon]
MITTTNINEARKQIQGLKKEGKQVIIQAQNDEFNRKILENKDVDIIVGLEFDRKDFLKQRNSGLNEILCKLAKENDIKIGVDISKVRRLDKLKKAKVLARMRQNIFLCRKIGCKIIIFGNDYNKQDYSKQEVMSFFLTFKGSTKQAIECFKN